MNVRSLSRWNSLEVALDTGEVDFRLYARRRLGKEPKNIWDMVALYITYISGDGWLYSFDEFCKAFGISVDREVYLCAREIAWILGPKASVRSIR